jgi:hypothetical protein
MAKLTPTQVYQLLRQAGYTPAAAVTQTAIAGAESGWDDSELGDVSLENNQWGPSYGLFQIRTLKGQTGSGSDRDISQLAGDDLAQAKAAYDISKGGTNFSPWTTYTRGTYQNFLAQAQSAAGGQTAGVSTTSVSTVSLPGPSWLWGPLNALTPDTGSILGSVRNIAVELGFAVLGLAVIYVGAITLIKPTADAKSDQLRSLATKVV